MVVLMWLDGDGTGDTGETTSVLIAVVSAQSEFLDSTTETAAGAVCLKVFTCLRNELGSVYLQRLRRRMP